MEWPEDPKPVGKLESGDGAGSARATRASPRGSASISDAESLNAGRGDGALNACGEAVAAASGKEGAAAAAAGADAFGDNNDDDERQSDDLIVVERPEVEAALCDAALIQAFSEISALKGGEVRLLRTCLRQGEPGSKKK